MISRGVAPNPTKDASGGQGAALHLRVPISQASHRLALRADKKLDQNFSTEKFYGANSVRSIQNIARLL